MHRTFDRHTVIYLKGKPISNGENLKQYLNQTNSRRVRPFNVFKILGIKYRPTLLNSD